MIFTSSQTRSTADVLLSSVVNKLEDANPLSLLHSFVLSLPTQTAVLSAVQTLVRLLLLHTASATDCSHVLLGTSLTSLSIALISSISQGGGFAVREEIEEEWSPSTGSNNIAGKPAAIIRVIRPLREVGMKECAAWVWWTGLRIVGREKLPGTNQGIGGLTKGNNTSCR
jgi:cytoplasmic tRNA 2-thiolation protein 2